MERRHYDEMRAADGEVRSHFRALADWLAETPVERVAEKRREADLLFHRVGITFAVYGDEAGAERLIPFDTIPRVIPKAEWDALAKGLQPARQRAQPLPRRHLPRPGDPQGRRDSRRAGADQRGLPGGDARPRPAEQGVLARRRHRPGAQRRRQVLRAGRQPAHALGRVLHAREPQDDDAAASRSCSRASACIRSSTTRACCSRR